MRFRLKAFAVHLSGSATVLALALGSLYAGWYYWPGWYLTGVARVAGIVAGVDVALGPLATLVIASPKKPRRELARDIAIIVAIQLGALGYGLVTLWSGRPLYYAFSEDRLQLVQAAEIPADEIEAARKPNPGFVPHWYSLPRWIWAPLPEDEAARAKILEAAVFGGKDVIDMPRYFKPWDAGVPELIRRLKPLDQLPGLTKPELAGFRRQLAATGIAPDQPVTMLVTGNAKTMVAVIDPKTAKVQRFVPEN